MLNTMTLILGLVLGVIILAYAVIVLIPLVSTFYGWLKLRRVEDEARDHVGEMIVNYHEKLGFTMADGGEKEKKED